MYFLSKPYSTFLPFRSHTFLHLVCLSVELVSKMFVFFFKDLNFVTPQTPTSSSTVPPPFPLDLKAIINNYYHIRTKIDK